VFLFEERRSFTPRAHSARRAAPKIGARHSTIENVSSRVQRHAGFGARRSETRANAQRPNEIVYFRDKYAIFRAVHGGAAHRLCMAMRTTSMHVQDRAHAVSECAASPHTAAQGSLARPNPRQRALVATRPRQDTCGAVSVQDDYR
jgi:hypothetical protein